MNNLKLTNLRELSLDEQLKLKGGEQITGSCRCSCNCQDDKVSDAKIAIADGVKKNLEK